MKNWVWKAAVGLGCALIVVYYLVPSGLPQAAVYLGIGVASILCLLIGVCWHRPERRAIWVLLIATNVCFVAGDAVSNVFDLLLHVTPPYPGISDALYLLGYPFLFTAVSLLARAVKTGIRERFLDAAIVCTAAVAVSWHLLMTTYADDDTVGTFGKVVTMAYPMMDLAVLFIIVAALFAGRTWRPADALLAGAVLVMVSADFVFDLLVLHGAYDAQSPVNAAFLLQYVLIAAAGLHPSIARPIVHDVQPPRHGRVPLVAVAGVLAPGITIIADIRGWKFDAGVLAATSLVLFGLVVTRVSWLVNSLRTKSGELVQRSDSLKQALTAQQGLETDLRHQAFHDGLTGLANRALLHDRVEHALRSSARSPGTIAVCFCDLDGFKSVNDSLGHQAGDQMLIAVSRKLASVVRDGDTIARLGGDEFAILIEGIEDVDIATELAGRIVSVLREPVTLGDRQISLSVSVGVTIAASGSTVETLLSEADAAMYEAKAGGKDRFALFQPAMRSRIMDQMQLRNAFQGSLHRDEYYVEYQPQVSLADNTLHGFEALVRWHHPELGNVGPYRFIPLAEETGFIVPLGRWILDTACLEAVTWQTPDRRLSVSVNLSARQLTEPNLVSDVINALSYSGLEPELLVLEITESVLMLDPRQAAQTMTRLKALGVRLAIDDFGTGYSSLAYLRQFPVDILKIDKSFIDPLEGASSAAGVAFVSAILRLAQDLNLETTAEGIEHDTQRAVLTHLQCTNAQGYLMSRPLPPDALPAYIDSADSTLAAR